MPPNNFTNKANAKTEVKTLKKILLILFIMLLTGCSKTKAKDTPLKDVMEEIKVVSEFTGGQTIDLTNQKSAAQYGIDSTSISEGYVYYSTDAEKADEIIIVRAADKKQLENVEKALSTELASKTAAWKNNEKESEKIKNHIMRTIGDCVLLAIGDKASEIDMVFNQLKEE